MKIKVKKIPTSIANLYYVIAEQLGYDPEKCNYDCTEIEVSEETYNIIDTMYEDKEAFAMYWLVFGPKVNEDLKGNEVVIHDGFIIKEEQ